MENVFHGNRDIPILQGSHVAFLPHDIDTPASRPSMVRYTSPACHGRLYVATRGTMASADPLLAAAICGEALAVVELTHGAPPGVPPPIYVVIRRALSVLSSCVAKYGQ